jgi:two-component system, OmpR family, sensor histidine kinase SenX3
VRKFRRDPEPVEPVRSASQEAALRELDTLRARVSLLEEVFDALALGVVVNNGAGLELFRNAAFVDTSTPRGVLAKIAVDEMIARTKSGPVSDVVEVHGPPRQSLKVTARELASGSTVATVEDVTEFRRIEAVRRDFVANISHELRTPVGAIGLLAETLSGETDPEIQARLTLRLETEAHRMATMVDDLLLLTRVEAEGGAAMEVIGVASIVSTVFERAEASAEFANVHLRVAVVPGDWRVRGDRRQLISALTNLVDNALKYSGEGTTVDLDVAMETTDAKREGFLEFGVSELPVPLVVFRVKDQGIGIPARDRERIFERFYRVDKARARDTGGTGLGLAIVRHVAVNHQGDVHVESVEGMGSTFVLRIPAAPQYRSGSTSTESSSDSVSTTIAAG